MRATFSKSFLTIFVGLFALTLFATQADAQDLRDWGKKFNNANHRFKVLNKFNDEAVLDRETQLVWEREPEGVTGWLNARFLCAGKNVGGRLGWRLATLSELTSLLDPSEFSPALTSDHPFLDVSNTIHYTATVSVQAGEAEPWGVDVLNGQVHFGLDPLPNRAYWCVRGPLAGPSAY